MIIVFDTNTFSFSRLYCTYMQLAVLLARKEKTVNKCLSNINDVDYLCKTISIELDLPESYYNMKLGDSESEDGGTYLFQIKGKTFARSPAPSNYTKIYIDKIIVLSLGLECLQKHLYWLFYRLMYEAAENSGSKFFGCCSRYKECSAGYGCVQPIKALRYDCIYRKNLFKGLNFFGKDNKIS